MANPKKIMISRTDGLGDLCLTLPVMGWLKSHFPDYKTQLLVAPYAESIARKSRFVDEVCVWFDRSETATVALLREAAPDHLIHVFPRREIAHAAKKAGIELRSGVVGRPYHWTTCNRWIWQSRKNSGMHEAHLNVSGVAKALGVTPPSAAEVRKWAANWVGYTSGTLEAPLESSPRVLLHPFSFGSGREWPIGHFAETARSLRALGWEVWVGGSAEEGEKLSPVQRDEFGPGIQWAFGLQNLAGYIQLIESMDAVIASGTGPLHVAGISGRKTVGLFPPKKSINSGRWAPIGPHVRVLEYGLGSGSPECKRPCSNTECFCMAQILPKNVISSVLS